MKKILWLGALITALGLTAYTTISNSKVPGAAQINQPRPGLLPMVSPRGEVPAPSTLRATRYA